MSTSGTGGSFGDAEAAALIAGEDLLSRDNVPDENQQTHCFSCSETLTGLFCHNCGQKNDDYRRSIWSLFSETFASIFSLENRMWRTWLMLLARPGRVSREFSDGRRTNWTSPVRIYLALSIMLFGYMGITETRIFSIRTDIVPKTDAEIEVDVSTLDDAAVMLSPDFGFFRRQAELDRLNAGTDFERVARLMKGTPGQAFQFDDDLSVFGDLPSNNLLKSSGSWPADETTDNDEELRQQALEIYAEKVDDAIDRYNTLLSATKNSDTIGTRIVEAEKENEPLDVLGELHFSDIDDVKVLSGEALNFIDNDLKNLGLSRKKIHNLPISLNDGYKFSLGKGNINGVPFTETDTQKLFIDVLRNPALLNDGISKYLPRIMFFMMPFAAIIGLIFIRGKKTALLYDHLVHATYIHAVTFAFLLVLILISQWTPLTGMSQIFLIGIALYLPLSAKVMFKRGWIKTVFASYSIAVFYALAMFFIVIVLTANSIVDAADLAKA